MNTISNRTKRIQSIDLLRGLVMVIMALDHVRDYTHHGFLFSNPTDLNTTTPALFFTRWITHFCAPVFVFLAGTSAFLYGQKQENTKTLSKFLFTRGLWLVFIELTVVNFAWTFDIRLGVHILQVIWAIGLSMIVLSVCVYLSKKALLVIGLAIVFLHNTLDNITFSGSSPFNILWYILHQSNFVPFSNGNMVAFAYPILPWIGVMILGYCFGSLYKPEFYASKRKQWLYILGSSSIVLFIILRALNIYGDMGTWSVQKNGLFTFMSFLNTTKYPPSLLYLLMTVGPSLFFLAITESAKGWLSKALVIIGRVPFFYYIIHLYIVHLIGFIALNVLGLNWKEYILTPTRFTSSTLASYGFDLWVTYVVWIMVVVMLYPLCQWYQQYKATNPKKWWLSYL